MATRNEVLIGSTERQGAIWAGILGVHFTVTLLAFQRVDGVFPIFIGMTTTAIGFGLAIGQAYRNGSLVLSLLFTTAPSLAVSVLIVTSMLPGEFTLPLGELNAGVFIGTTAHLLGIGLAESRGNPPHPIGDTERRASLALLIITGAIFTYTHVVS